MAKTTRPRYTPKLKCQVVLEALSGDKAPAQIATAYGVHPNAVGLWRNTVMEAFNSRFKVENLSLFLDARTIAELTAVVDQGAQARFASPPASAGVRRPFHPPDGGRTTG